MDDWIKDHFWNFIILPILAAWLGVTKWFVNRLFSEYERRVQKTEYRIDELKREIDDTEIALSKKIDHQSDKIDSHYRAIDSKIDLIYTHLMTRPHSERYGDNEKS